MWRTITFFVPGSPEPQPRVRAYVRGRHARVYDPGNADNWKRTVAIYAKPNRLKEPLLGPIEMELEFFLQRPKSHFGSKGLKASAPLWPTSRPDVDNLAKAVMDALKDTVLYRDDAQIVSLLVQKRYSLATPGCAITIRYPQTQ